MYFTQNLLENWILGGNLVVDKTLRKLPKPTTSRDNDICYNCYLLLVEQGKGCTIQSLSADQRGQRQSKNLHNKEKGKRVRKRVAYHLVLCLWYKPFQRNKLLRFRRLLKELIYSVLFYFVV